MTLFPDYPPIESTSRPKPPCCADWGVFVQDNPEPPLVYAVVHAFAHGRVPFTLDALAERANTTLKGAEGAVKVALHRDWVARVHPEPYMRHSVLHAWVGRLPRKR